MRRNSKDTESKTPRKIKEGKHFLFNGTRVDEDNNKIYNFDEHVKGLDASYDLSNIPFDFDKENLQVRHIEFSEKQLAEMYECPKIIIDGQQLGRYVDREKETKYKTVFFAVAPDIILEKNPSSEKKIPGIYEIIITAHKNHPEHYSISIYGLVDGTENGHVFLARLDNNDDLEAFHRNKYFTKKDIDKQRKLRNIIPDFIHFKHDEFLDRLKDRLTRNGYGAWFITPFPHLHAVDGKHFLKTPESVEPIFVKKLANKRDIGIPHKNDKNNFKSLNTSLRFMLERFNVSEKAELPKDNILVSKLAKEIKDTHTISENPVYEDVINIISGFNNHSNREIEKKRTKEKNNNLKIN
ncbi:MAG: hypothetical protein IJ837_01855 [Clostridia bacterium]|nr:hypothetical protein [Clostridia bacterium]